MYPRAEKEGSCLVIQICFYRGSINNYGSVVPTSSWEVSPEKAVVSLEHHRHPLVVDVHGEQVRRTWQRLLEMFASTIAVVVVVAAACRAFADPHAVIPVIV